MERGDFFCVCGYLRYATRCLRYFAMRNTRRLFFDERDLKSRESSKITSSATHIHSGRTSRPRRCNDHLSCIEHRFSQNRSNESPPDWRHNPRRIRRSSTDTIPCYKSNHRRNRYRRRIERKIARRTSFSRLLCSPHRSSRRGFSYNDPLAHILGHRGNRRPWCRSSFRCISPSIHRIHWGR